MMQFFPQPVVGKLLFYSLLNYLKCVYFKKIREKNCAGSFV